MKYEDYIHIYNSFARLIGMPPIERCDGLHEKGKTYKHAKVQTFPFILQ